MIKNMEKRTGMVICKINNECAPKIINAPNHRPTNTLSHNHSHKTFSIPSSRTTSNHSTCQTDIQNKSNYKRNGKRKIERLKKSINLLITLVWSQTLILIMKRTIGMSTNMKPLYKQLNFKKRLRVTVNNLVILHNIGINYAIKY